MKKAISTLDQNTNRMVELSNEEFEAFTNEIKAFDSSLTGQSLNVNSSKVSLCDTNTSLTRQFSAEEARAITIYPFLNIIPAHSPEELASLEASLLSRANKANITVIKRNSEDGENVFQCIDGRAILEIYLKYPDKFEPIFTIFEGDESEIHQFILQMNVIRRHLNKGQRAILAVRIYEFIIENRRKNKDYSFFGIKIDKGQKTRTAIAKFLAISETLFEKALTICRHAPEYCVSILDESCTLDHAHTIAKERNPKTIAQSSKKNEDTIEPAVSSNENYDETKHVSSESSQCDYSTKEETDEILNDYEVATGSKASVSVTSAINVSTVDEFENKFRQLNPIEKLFVELSRDKIRFPKAEQIIVKLLVKEEAEQRQLDTGTEDNKFDYLSEIFIDSITTPASSEEQFQPEIISLYQNKVEKVQGLREQNETMSFDEQVKELRNQLSSSEQEYLDRAINVCNAQKDIKLNHEHTLLGKVSSFVISCNDIIHNSSLKLAA